MRNVLRWMVMLVLLSPIGCSQDAPTSDLTGQIPIVRVLLLNNRESVVISAPRGASVSIDNAGLMPVPMPTGGVRIELAPTGWRVGSVQLGKGSLVITPATGTALAVNGNNYRGRLRLVATDALRFDCINDLDIDSYLMGVLPRELPFSWNVETYRAQAIVARTYALFSLMEARASNHPTFDLFADTRSQVYGGLDAEIAKSRSAVNDTSGIVVAYGLKGHEKIFKAYFSSCCGGITQSASDAFGDSYIEPLSDQDVHGRCNASPRFSWGPIAVKKDELTRRFRLFGQRRNRAEQAMAPLARIDVQKVSRFGRPVRFLITDARGARFSWTGEEMRWAVNTDAPQDSNLFSSFFRIINEPDTVRFVEGHGFGHGAGLCQWCSEKLADEGMRHEDIVLAAYQRAVLKRAY